MIRRLIGVALCALVCGGVSAQGETELLARARVFPEVGPGVTAFKRDAAGRYYVLTARAGAVAVYSADGKRVAQIPSSAASGQASIIYGADFDLDASGNVYVADPGANSVKVFSPAGALLRTVSVASPNSVAVLPEGEIAVVSTVPVAAKEPNPRLITVFDARGKLVREIGDPIEIAERNEVNRLLGLGRVLSDPAGRLYYAYTYLPEPTLRRYDRFGFTTLELELNTLEFQPAAQATRREIKKQDAKGGRPALNPVINAAGVDFESGDIWLAIGSEILRFDKEGYQRGEYRVFTNEGAHLEPVAIVVERDRLLLASDTLGIFEFPRPDKLSR